MKKTWQLQQAKQRRSEVIRCAAVDEPQMITHHGQPSAWIISDQEYTKLTQQQESIVDFFQKSPHREVELKIERRKDSPRSIEL